MGIRIHAHAHAHTRTHAHARAQTRTQAVANITRCIVAATCGGFLKLTETSGSFQSPNYPNHYADGTHCIWQLQAPKNNIIAMTVVAVNGQANSTGQCVDFVEVSRESIIHECLHIVITNIANSCISSFAFENTYIFIRMLFCWSCLETTKTK